MKQRFGFVLLVGLITIAFTSSCSALKPPESCGFGGFVNETGYSLYFDDLHLLDVDGEVGVPERDGTPRFKTGQAVNLWLQVKSDARVRVCVEETRGGGEIPFDETTMLSAGQNAITFGMLERGPYLIHVSIDGTLVRSIPFSVR